MIIQQTYKRPSHEFGQCISSKASKLLYINIPKNASTWAKDYFVFGYNWDNFSNFAKYNLLKNFHKIVILRDPYERWLSGISTYIMRDVHYLQMTKEVMKLITTKIEFDEHTKPQTNFLNGIDTSDCTFFRVDHSLDKDIQNFMDYKKQVKSDRFHMVKSLNRNELEHINFRTALINYTKDNKEFMDRLEEYYKDDYNLMNRVKFYTQRVGAI